MSNQPAATSKEQYLAKRTAQVIKRYQTKGKYRNLSDEQVQVLAKAEARMDWVKKCG